MAAILRIKDENGNIVSIPAIKGDKGDKGDRGLPGSGGVPDGGTAGQVLTKNSDADGDAGWKNSSGAEFSDDGSGNISVNGASSDAKRFLNSLTFPGLNYKYVNPINSGTYASPYGVYISSGTVIDYVVGLTQVGFYTAYVNRRVTDIPDVAKAANSSLRGFVCVSQIDNTASGGSQKCYAYIALIDQNSNFYIQYIQGSVGGGWKRMYPYETAESALMEKLDKNQGTANSGKFLGIGADGIVVPTEVGGGSGWTELYQGTIEVLEPVSSLTVNLTKSCEGMTEAIMSFESTKGEGELTGNTSMHCKFGLFGVTYGRLGNYSAACDDKYYLLAPNKYQSMFYKNQKAYNSIYYNAAQCLVGWVEPIVLNNPNYNQMIIDFWGSPGYQGTITLRIVGR